MATTELQPPTGLERNSVRAVGRYLNSILADSLRALPQDQELPLARLGPAFPRLSSDARRAGRPDLCGDGRIAERVRKLGGTTLRRSGTSPGPAGQGQ